jgi:hypothetical protein
MNIVRASLSQLTWPHLCACCLGPVDTTLELAGGGTVPYCGWCLNHVAEATRPYTVLIDGRQSRTREVNACHSLGPGCTSLGPAVQVLHADGDKIVLDFSCLRYADAFAAANGTEVLDVDPRAAEQEQSRSSDQLHEPEGPNEPPPPPPPDAPEKAGS